MKQLVICLLIASQSFAVGQSLNPAWGSRPTDVSKLLVMMEKKRILKRALAFQPPTAAEKQKIRDGVKAALLKPAEAMSHTAQTMMQLWILAGVYMLYQEQQMKPLQPATPPMSESFAKIGDELLNGSDIYFGMIGASAMGSVLHQPISAMNQVIASTTARPALRALLQSGPQSFVTFVGWEAGAMLWQEAIFSLDESDIPTARNLRFIDMMRGQGSREQQLVFQKVLNNALNILLFKDFDTTLSWIGNTWRLRIMTGEFVTLLTSMVTAGALAGSIVPGAGTFVGMCFGFAGGLAGGALAMLIPEEFKQTITDEINNSRIRGGYQRLKRNEIILKSYQRILRGPETNMTQTQVDGFEIYLKQRQTDREAIITAWVDQIYAVSLKAEQAQYILAMAEQNQNIQLIRNQNLEDLLAAAANPNDAASLNSVPNPSPSANRPLYQGRFPLQTTDLKSERANLLAFYKEQIIQSESKAKDLFKGLLQLQVKEAELMADISTDISENLPTRVQRLAAGVLTDQQNIHQLIRQVAAGLFPHLAQEFNVDVEPEETNDLKAAAQVMLNTLHLRGTQESVLL